MWGVVLVVVVAAAVGLVAGAGLRRLLARIRRGMVMSTPATELACAALTVLGVATCWGTARLWLVFFSGLLVVALVPVDWRHHRLPDAITLPAIVIAAFIISITAFAAPGTGSLRRAVVTAAVLWSAFAAVAWISPRSMGRGDVKLVPTLGLLTGFVSIAAAVTAIVLAFVLGAVVAVIGLTAGRLKLKSAIPFGPCLLTGTWLVLAFPVLGQWLAQ